MPHLHRGRPINWAAAVKMAHSVNFPKYTAANFAEKIMNLKKSILAIFAAFLVSNVLTTLWYMLTDEANFVPYRRPEINYAGLLANHLLYAGLFVYFFPYYYERSPKKIQGFIYGLLMGALMFLPSAMVIRSIWEVDFNTIFILNSLAHVFIGGAMGFVVALIYGKGM